MSIIANDQTAGCMFVLESFRRHMDNGRWLFQRGLEQQGYVSAGGGLPPPGIDRLDVAEIVECCHPSVVIFWPRYEWDPAEWGGSEVLPEHCFQNWECLLDMPEILRATVFHDAGSARAEQKRWHEVFRPDVYLTWYHHRSILALAPHVPSDRLLRIYHVIDADEAPAICDRDGVGVVSGAYARGVYPLRTRAVAAAKAGRLGPDVGCLDHPGYFQVGPSSTEYVKLLSQYRVALCTASSYGFALRKIIEATLAGCVVITDLPEYDRLPGIDDNLVRVRPTISIPELRELIRDQADAWDLKRQTHYATTAAGLYDWRIMAETLARKLTEWPRTT